ncbi:MAG: CrcB family protein [Parvularcula sp.]|jgi:CrcB protein|nr:CrcB family protein [Parvularcula sp.]
MQAFMSQILAAAAGGAIGAAGRLAFLKVGLSGAAGILALNVAGSFGLGLALALLEGRPAWLIVFVGAGIFGGLTTFSSFAGDAVRLLTEAPMQGVAYIAASVMFAVAAFAVGSWIGRAL